ncbi:MAG: hypothetical protein KKF24_13650 [Gammaproteobacteria bacterium]|nr:hypothetical protein [Gammaproteobacteria bacterium]MBU1833726.1 hypothetical protein [Gammaproteobacteria bacterium]
MKRNTTKQLVAAAILTSMASFSMADPLAPITTIIAQLGGGFGGLSGAGIPGLDALPLGALPLDGGLPGLDSLPLDPSALLGGGGNLVSLGALPVTPSDLISAFQLIPIQPVFDLIGGAGLPFDSVLGLLGNFTDVNTLPINPFALLSGGGLTAIPVTPALLLGGGLPGLAILPIDPLGPILGGGLPGLDALPVDFLAFIPI